jgi:hypothetical protein
VAPRRLRPLSLKENGLFEWVELMGLEPLTPTLPGRDDPFGAVRRGSMNGFELGIRTGGTVAYNRECRHCNRNCNQPGHSVASYPPLRLAHL